jgi:GTP pyrophosphokinase
LDFAFEIHTQVGSKCIGAKVNNRLVPINYVLKNGDQIEILTSQKQKPHEDWLRFVVSSKAKSRIKDELKEDKRKSADEGKEILIRSCVLQEEPTQQLLEQMREYFKVPANFELYYRVGRGFITTADIKKFVENKPVSTPKPKITQPQEPKLLEQESSQLKGRYNDILLIGEDMDVVDYKLAKCCTPIPGDDVFGFVSVSEGIKIHHGKNAPELLSHHETG